MIKEKEQLLKAHNVLWEKVIEERLQELTLHNPRSPFTPGDREISEAELSPLSFSFSVSGESHSEMEIEKILEAYRKAKREMSVWDSVLRGLFYVYWSKTKGIRFSLGVVAEAFEEETSGQPHPLLKKGLKNDPAQFPR